MVFTNANISHILLFMTSIFLYFFIAHKSTNQLQALQF